MTERWPAEKRIAFELFGPQAIYVVAPDKSAAITVFNADGSTHRVIGHNQRSWPVKIGITKSFKDTVSPNYKSPWVQLRMCVRLWFPELDDAQVLVNYVTTLLYKAAEAAGYHGMLNGFIEAGPKFEPASFERHITTVTRRLGIVTWDELALSKFLDEALLRAKQKGIMIADRRGQRIMSMAPAFIRLCDQLVLKARTRQFGKAEIGGTERLQ